MTRTTLLAAFSLVLLGEAPASTSNSGELDRCTSAFLNEHLNPQEAAAMLRLWAAGSMSGSEPSTTGSTDAPYDAEVFTRAGRRFLNVKVLYQMRCPDQKLGFE
jgi:hypothetical protein